MGCRCLPSVNTICGRIMIGLSLSSVSKHNMWSYYDWVVIVDPIIIRPHIVLTDGRKRNPNRNTTTYCVYWRKTTTTQSHVVVLWLGCHCHPSVNTICGRIMIGLSLSSSVSKHNMWSHYDDNPIIIRPHIVFSDGRQQQHNHNTTTYCVYWRTTTTTTP
jgi:hypothetical protein